ncbi:MAG: hypothetical protein ACE5GE_00180 [Phycisphaerae bacterium]
MKRSILAVLTLLAAPLTGCVAASVHDNQFRHSRQAVSHEGRVYLIDTDTGAAQIIDISAAKPFVPREAQQ